MRCVNLGRPLGRLCLAGALASALLASASARALAAGPLRVHPDNPRYFTDGSGKAIYLTGAHVWNDFLDWGTADPPPPLDFRAFLERARRYNHNFIRGWTWLAPQWPWPYAEGQPTWYFSPAVFMRTGPGRANDGKPKFDLTRVNPAYLRRLRERAGQARNAGIYVSVMFFDCALGVKRGAKPPPQRNSWHYHPFHANNNINGVNGDVNGDGEGWESQQLPRESGVSPAALELQEAYVETIVDALHDLDNIIWEIVNEGLVASDAWQNHMIAHVQAYERQRGYRPHLVWKTAHYEPGQVHRVNALLLDSPADIISLNPASIGDYRRDPPAADGRKVSLLDTDHLWGIGGSADWVWKAFTRGHHPIFMDPAYPNPWGADRPAYESVRLALGHTRAYARRMNLAAAVPQAANAESPCSTRYCLHSSGEYLAYQPGAGRFTLALAPGAYSFEWFDTEAGKAGPGGRFRWRGGRRSFIPPPPGHRVLYVAARKDIAQARTNHVP